MKNLNLFALALLITIFAACSTSPKPISATNMYPPALSQSIATKVRETNQTARRRSKVFGKHKGIQDREYSPAELLTCPLTNHQQISSGEEKKHDLPLAEDRVTEYTRQYFRYDTCFKTYNPLFLSAFSATIADFRIGTDSINLFGLTDTREEICTLILKEYELDNRCSRPENPETVVMVAAALVLKAEKIIRDAETCQKLVEQDRVDWYYWLYIGFDSGLLVLESVLEDTCKPDEAEHALIKHLGSQIKPTSTP